MPKPVGHEEREVIILTTKAMARTINYYNYLFRINRKSRTITLDSWPSKIDNGELDDAEIFDVLLPTLGQKPYLHKELVLACSQFNDISNVLRSLFGKNLKIYDGFSETITSICKVLKIRGQTGKKA